MTPHENAPERLATHRMQTNPYQNQNNIKQQNAMKLPKIMPSLLFFVPILCISPLMPGICAAAPVILLWILLRLSLCNAKLSFTAYA
jgi:hypothetical protein